MSEEKGSYTVTCPLCGFTDTNVHIEDVDKLRAEIDYLRQVIRESHVYLFNGDAAKAEENLRIAKSRMK